MNILILHGWMSKISGWKEIKEALIREGHIVYLPVLPGTPESDFMPQDWGLEEFSDWVLDYIYEHNLSNIALIGHSFGGQISVKLINKRPELFTKLILICSAGIRDRDILREKRVSKSKLIKFVRYLRQFTILNKLLSFPRKLYYSSRKSSYLSSEHIKGTFLKVTTEDIQNLLPTIQTPTLIIWGKKDKITPLSDSSVFKSEIPNSRLTIFNNSGHKPYIDESAALIKEIKGFI